GQSTVAVWRCGLLRSPCRGRGDSGARDERSDMEGNGMQNAPARRIGLRRRGSTLLAILVGTVLATGTAPLRSSSAQSESSCPGRADQTDFFAAPQGYSPNGLHAWLRADMCTDNIAGNSFRYWFGSDTRTQSNGSYKNVSSITQGEQAWNGDDSNDPCTKTAN